MFHGIELRQLRVEPLRDRHLSHPRGKNVASAGARQRRHIAQQLSRGLELFRPDVGEARVELCLRGDPRRRVFHERPEQLDRLFVECPASVEPGRECCVEVGADAAEQRDPATALVGDQSAPRVLRREVGRVARPGLDRGDGPPDLDGGLAGESVDLAGRVSGPLPVLLRRDAEETREAGSLDGQQEREHVEGLVAEPLGAAGIVRAVAHELPPDLQKTFGARQLPGGRGVRCGVRGALGVDGALGHLGGVGDNGRGGVRARARRRPRHCGDKQRPDRCRETRASHLTGPSA